eukprot:TRINITY_DN13465_c0_g1_i2.p1 TRINITY_DN13465_c0_g1~~TRINITY_DN13465_c0_g1_i2.p1  ORF type:complete len:319 (-),score=69.84 TRINITY_DN13465_c0_g1_i2:102-1058(-)
MCIRDRYMGYMRAYSVWRKMEEDTSNEETGHWWHELRSSVIKNEEKELEEIDKREYDSCIEKNCLKFHSRFVLFNWKTLARNVWFPVIYRFFLLPVLLSCFVALIMMLARKSHEWHIVLAAVIDLVAIACIGVQEMNAVAAFLEKRKMKGRRQEVSDLIGNIAFPCIILHILCAVFTACTAPKESNPELLIYLITAFSNDLYHYCLGLLFYLNILILNLGSFLELVLTCKFFAHHKVHKATLNASANLSLERIALDTRTCHICLEEIRGNESWYSVGCREEDVYHKECLEELYGKVKRCPMCKRKYELPKDVDELGVV